MTHVEAAAIVERAGARRPSRALLAAAAVAAPAVVALALATGAWWLLPVLGGAVVLGAWSLADVRVALVVAVLLATFVDYNTGRLAPELAVVCAWLAFTALLLFWRSAWKGWVLPPPELTRGLVIWLGACAFGVIVGLFHGNALRNIGLELAAALWPVFAIGMMQAYGRRSAAHAGLGLVAIGLIHTAFGLTMLHVYHQRLGGIYFTPVTGIAAVGLWTAALLAPNGRVRALCLAGMIPMLAHLLFSFTRGYWLGCMAGMAIATVLSWRSLGRFEPEARRRRLLALPALAAVLAATVALSILYFGGGDLLAAIGGRFGSSFSTTVSGETLSNVIRLAEYDRAIASALRSPVIGNGLGYAFVMKDLLLGTSREQWFVHNYYLLLWLKLGVVGLAAFGALLWGHVRAAKRALDRDRSWLVRAWSITAIAVTGQLLVILLTNYSLADVNTAFTFAYVWGAAWAVQADAREERA